MTLDFETFKERVSFLIAQELSIACPKDTSLMASSFMNYDTTDEKIISIEYIRDHEQDEFWEN
jgi:hypothetical protein